MKQRHPFEKVLDQITDLLAVTVDNKSKKFSEELDDKEIKEQLEAITKDVELFQKMTEEAITKSGMSPELIDETVKEGFSGNLSMKERKILKRTEKLKKELVSEERFWGIQSNLAKMGAQKKKTRGKKRKKKFKRLGGQGWIPL